MKVKDILAAGDLRLDLEANKGRSGYSGAFYRDGSPIKLSLEKIEESQFIETFLDRYYFGQTEKKYNAGRKFLARLGFHGKSTIQMDFADNTYKFKYQAEVDSIARNIQLLYYPGAGRMVVRANRR